MARAKSTASPTAISPPAPASPASSCRDASEISNATSPAAASTAPRFMLPSVPIVMAPTAPWMATPADELRRPTLGDADAANLLTLLATGHSSHTMSSDASEHGGESKVCKDDDVVHDTGARGQPARPAARSSTASRSVSRKTSVSSASDSSSPTPGGPDRARGARKARGVVEEVVAYRQKRQRNNEAVRKCRIKKKQQSEQRENRLSSLESRVAELEAENRALRQQLEGRAPDLTKHRGGATRLPVAA